MAAELNHEGRHEELLGQIRALAASAAEDASVEIVELRVSGSSRSRRIRVDIDRAGPVSVSHEDCRLVSSALDRAIEDAGILSDGYVLEVSSPGADRPICTADDARRNVGRRVVVSLRLPLDGRRELRGVLMPSEIDSLRVVEDEMGEVCIPRDRVAMARQDLVF